MMSVIDEARCAGRSGQDRPAASLFLVECVEACRQPLDSRLQAGDLVTDPGLILAGVGAWDQPRRTAAQSATTTAEAATAGAAGTALPRATSGTASSTASGICTLSSRSGTVFIWHDLYLSEVVSIAVGDGVISRLQRFDLPAPLPQ